MIPWYRQVLSLILSFGIILITLFGIDQSNGMYLIGAAMAMSFLSLLLIFGVEIEEIKVETSFVTVTIPFTNTSPKRRGKMDTDDEDDAE